jgi:hypothetical protein
MAESETNKFGAEAPKKADQLRQKLARRLTATMVLPSWGPHVSGSHAAQISDASIEADQDDYFGVQGIARKIEYSRKLAPYLPIYIAAGIFSAGVFLLALYVAYRMTRSQFWLYLLSNSFIPEALYGSRFFMALQVVIAVLAIHSLARLVGFYRCSASLRTSIALFVLLACSIGFLVANNTASTARSVEPALVTTVAEERIETIDELYASLGEPRDGQSVAVATGPVQFSPTGTLDSIEVPEGASGWLWVFFAGSIFVAVIAIAAIYLRAAEQNIKNAYIAGDCARRIWAYTQFCRLELSASNAAGTHALG